MNKIILLNLIATLFLSSCSKNKTELMLNDFEKLSYLYERDPLFYITNSIMKYYSNSVFPQFQYDEREINELQKLYLQGQKELFKDKK